MIAYLTKSINNFPNKNTIIHFYKSGDYTLCGKHLIYSKKEPWYIKYDNSELVNCKLCKEKLNE